MRALAASVTILSDRNRLIKKPSTVLDESGHGCGRFNEIKAKSNTTI